MYYIFATIQTVIKFQSASIFLIKYTKNQIMLFQVHCVIQKGHRSKYYYPNGGQLTAVCK